MGIIISKSDFVGDYRLVKSNSDDIDSFIEKYEKQIIMQMLGSDLLDLFMADLTNKVPVTDIYLDIYNPFVKKVQGRNIESEGMKNMVLGYVYFFYQRKMKIKSSMNGAVINQTEVADQANPTFLFRMYNETIATYKAIQYYCRSNSSIYPVFCGVNKAYSSFI